MKSVAPQSDKLKILPASQDNSNFLAASQGKSFDIKNKQQPAVRKSKPTSGTQPRPVSSKLRSMASTFTEETLASLKDRSKRGSKMVLDNLGELSASRRDGTENLFRMSKSRKAIRGTLDINHGAIPVGGVGGSGSALTSAGKNEGKGEVPWRAEDKKRSKGCFSLCNETKAREKERESLSYHFLLQHHSTQTADTAIEGIINRSPYFAYFDKLKNLEFRVNEFLPFHTTHSFNKTLPLLVIQFEGVFGTCYSNLASGIELVLTKKFTCTDFSNRKGPLVDSSILDFLLKVSAISNPIVVFQKWNSKTKQMAKALKDAPNELVKGIYYKKINNRSSRFISYSSLLEHFKDCCDKVVFVIGPLKMDMDYWKMDRARERREGVRFSRYLNMEEIMELDTILPLYQPSHSKLNFQIGLVEDFRVRERISDRRAEEAHEIDGQYRIEASKDVFEKIELFIKGYVTNECIHLIPYDYMTYFEFFESVAYRNYLKNIRRRDDDIANIEMQAAKKEQYGIDISRTRYPPLYQSNLNLLTSLPNRQSIPIYDSPLFLLQLKEFASLNTRKNSELDSIVRLSKSLLIL